MAKRTKRRKTTKVQVSWLEDAPATDVDEKPPQMPGAAVTVPPLPITASETPKRNTIPVQDDWLEIVDDETPKTEAT